MKINPEHPVTQELDQHWHKLAAIVMRRLGATSILVTKKDLDEAEGSCIVATAKKEGILLETMTMAEGIKKAKDHPK